jgi:hypothetical protein
MGLWWSRKMRKASEVMLITRQGCHLCEEAKATLLAEAADLRITETDVDGDPALKELYGECVPVVLIDGKVRFRGRVNRVLLRRLLR